MSSKTVTWIHLSDCHMEAEDRFNRNIVLGALWADIRQLRNRGLAADFVAFTGDVAYHGFPVEYELAARELFDPLLAAAEVPKERLFVIPGNHDVDRKKTAMLVNPLGSIRNEDDLRKLLEGPDERSLILSPLRGYQQFVESYIGNGNGRNLDPFGASESIIVGDNAVTVLGLNTAWLCGFNRDSKGAIDDCRHLAVSEFQVRKVLSANAGFQIALMHHPLDWLLEFDQVAVEDLLARTCPVILRGHLHRPNAFATQSLAGDSMTIPAGAVFDRRRGSESPNSYNVSQLNFETGKLSVYFRRYNDRREEWQKDIESTGEGLDGRADFSLKLQKKAWVIGIPEQSIQDISHYKCSLTQVCRQNLSRLRVSESELLSLVQAEFASHVNYFLFDLEHYPLPLGTRFIVYLHKVQDHITFEQLVPATHNQIQLARWNDLLALYRRATRLNYRQDPTKLAFLDGVAQRACALHEELVKRMMKYYLEFEGLPKEAHRAKKGGNKRNRQRADPKEVYAHLGASRASLQEAMEVEESIKLGDISAERAVGLIAASLETSLQHIHKLILLYPPKS
jgi:hypothetical protein